MIDKDNRCQGCGAPIRGRACDYCGRVFDDEYGYATENAMYADDVPLVIETVKSNVDIKDVISIEHINGDVGVVIIPNNGGADDEN